MGVLLIVGVLLICSAFYYSSERTKKLLLNDHSAGILSIEVILYLEGVSDDKTLSRNTFVHKYNIKLNSSCWLCARV